MGIVSGGGMLGFLGVHWPNLGNRRPGRHKGKPRLRDASARFEQLESRNLLAVSVLYPAVTLDPADRLTTSNVLGEWSGTTQDGWVVNNSPNTIVAGGTITVSSANGTSGPTQLDLTNIAAGANLNLGYFDYLQFRMQLPASFN